MLILIKFDHFLCNEKLNKGYSSVCITFNAQLWTSRKISVSTWKRGIKLHKPLLSISKMLISNQVISKRPKLSTSISSDKKGLAVPTYRLISCRKICSTSRGFPKLNISFFLKTDFWFVFYASELAILMNTFLLLTILMKQIFLKITFCSTFLMKFFFHNFPYQWELEEGRCGSHSSAVERQTFRYIPERCLGDLMVGVSNTPGS